MTAVPHSIKLHIYSCPGHGRNVYRIVQFNKKFNISSVKKEINFILTMCQNKPRNAYMLYNNIFIEISVKKLLAHDHSMTTVPLLVSQLKLSLTLK